VGDIKSEQWARSPRNAGRHQIGMVGGFARNHHFNNMARPVRRMKSFILPPNIRLMMIQGAEKLLEECGRPKKTATLPSDHLARIVCRQGYLSR
jgi:hypothetical protein